MRTSSNSNRSNPRRFALRAIVVTGLVSGAVTLLACAGESQVAPGGQAPVGASAGPIETKPCSPGDCAPCDLTKSKCTGPTVCDGHPERAHDVCERSAAGTCERRLACD